MVFTEMELENHPYRVPIENIEFADFMMVTDWCVETFGGIHFDSNQKWSRSYRSWNFAKEEYRTLFIIRWAELL